MEKKNSITPNRMVDVVIIGAGPYGLSIAAHFRHRGISFRIFGRPMDSWCAHMPKGMFLKSDGFASNLYDPDGSFTLEQFCADQGIGYSGNGIPVSLKTFSEYGLAFSERMVPDVDKRLVIGIEPLQLGFLLRLEDGETLMGRRVVLAVGITHFEHMPEKLAHLPPEFVSHSFRHHDLEPFRGRKVVVLGGGASAIDLAGLLHEAGAEVQLIARKTSLRFHNKAPMDRSRSLWRRMRHPQSGIGPGLRLRFFANAPAIFHYLPESLRLEAVRRSLGPAAGWFAKDKVIGLVPLVLGHTVDRANVKDGVVRLHLRGKDGIEKEILTEHIIAATGYRVDLGRLTFLSATLRSKLKVIDQTPVLSSTFESSISGLYFVGIAAANSFGPVQRFAFGANFAARNLTRTMTKLLVRETVSFPASGTEAVSK